MWTLQKVDHFFSKTFCIVSISSLFNYLGFKTDKQNIYPRITLMQDCISEMRPLPEKGTLFVLLHIFWQTINIQTKVNPGLISTLKCKTSPCFFLSLEFPTKYNKQVTWQYDECDEIGCDHHNANKQGSSLYHHSTKMTTLKYFSSQLPKTGLGQKQTWVMIWCLLPQECFSLWYQLYVC